MPSACTGRSGFVSIDALAARSNTIVHLSAANEKVVRYARSVTRFPANPIVAKPFGSIAQFEGSDQIHALSWMPGRRVNYLNWSKQNRAR